MVQKSVLYEFKTGLKFEKITEKFVTERERKLFEREREKQLTRKARRRFCRKFFPMFELET